MFMLGIKWLTGPESSTGGEPFLSREKKGGGYLFPKNIRV